MEKDTKLLKRLILVEDLEYRKLYIPTYKISSSRDFVDFARKYLYPEDRINVAEYFTAVFVDKGNNPIGFTQNKGSIDGVVADFAEIVAIAVSIKASGVFLCHNHPSGRINPSESDNNLTERFKKSFEPLGISLIDHIILTEHSYYSYSDEGVLSMYQNCTYFVMGKEICQVLINGEDLEEYLEKRDRDNFGLFVFTNGVTLPSKLADALLGYEDFQTVAKEIYDLLLKHT